MKRILAMLTVLVLLFSLVGCFDGTNRDSGYSHDSDSDYDSDITPTTMPEKTPLEKISEYITKNGTYDDGSYYWTVPMGTTSKVNSVTASLIWNQSKSSLEIGFVIGMKDGGSAGGMLQYDPNTDKQRVLSSMTLTNPIETFYTHGTFYKSTFTKNSNVTVTKNDNIYDETPNDTLQNTAVMLLGYTELLLEKSGTGVTLYDLGFTSWTPLS